MVRTRIVSAVAGRKRSAFAMRFNTGAISSWAGNRSTFVAAATVKMPAATATAHTLAKKVPMGASPDGNSGNIHNAACIVREQTNKGFT